MRPVPQLVLGSHKYEAAPGSGLHGPLWTLLKPPARDTGGHLAGSAHQAPSSVQHTGDDTRRRDSC